MMKQISVVLCFIAVIYPVQQLIELAQFSDLLHLFLSIVFIAMHGLPLIYLYLRIPNTQSHIALQIYWLVVILLLMSFSHLVYFDWANARQLAEYQPDAQEGIIFFIVPLYQLGLAFLACVVRRLLATQLTWFKEPRIICSLFSLNPKS